MDNKWIYFIMTIGFLSIATAPMMNNPTPNIIVGILIVILSFYQAKKSNKKK